MIIQGFGRTSSPKNMSVSALKVANSFSIKTKIFGFETGSYLAGSFASVTQLRSKGHNIFPDGNAPSSEKFLTVTANIVDGHFGSNTSAYNLGLGLAAESKFLICDFENEYGNYANLTNLERVAHFIKGAKDGGARVGEFLHRVFNDVAVWDNAAKTQITNPVMSGLGTNNVAAMNRTMGSLYGFNIVLGYGVNYVTGRRDFDPRATIYDYVYKLRVHKAMIKNGIVPADCISVGFLWGGCDGFNSGKPMVKHRVYLDAPYGGYLNIDNYDEESQKTIKGYALWAFVEAEGAIYWGPKIASSDTKNDVIDILYSSYPHCSSHGTSGLPGSRPNPIRMYPYLDGLSQDATYESAYEFAQIEDMLDGGQKSDPDFSFRRGNGFFEAVVKPADGTGIVDDYSLERPIVAKIVKGNKVLFVVQDPAAAQGKTTKIKVSHANKTWLISLNADDPKISQFTF